MKNGYLYGKCFPQCQLSRPQIGGQANCKCGRVLWGCGRPNTTCGDPIEGCGRIFWVAESLPATAESLFSGADWILWCGDCIFS